MDGLTFAGLHFLRPLWLLGLPLLPVLAWWWRLRERRRSLWRDVVDPHLLPHLIEGGTGRRGLPAGPWLALSALALALLALAGPGWRRAEQPLWRAKAPLVVALDLSSATLAGDLPPTRLAQARAKIAQLLQARQGGQVALVAYAADAYTVAPLTDDVANIALFLDALEPDVMPEDGDRPDRAIEWSVRLLRQAGFDQGDVLLLAGDAGGDARGAAGEAAAQGYRVSVLGLGTAAGAAYRRPDGSIAQARLDAARLRAVAAAGDGGYAALSSGPADLAGLGVLDPDGAGARATRRSASAAWQDQGYWLLPPLLLLAALMFRRGGALAVLALCLWLPLAPARAQQAAPAPAPAQPAAAGPAQRPGPGLWRRADQQAHARMRQGAREYREGDYAAAGRAFATVDDADGAYNLGNALARQGRYEEAIAAYDRALARAPGMADAQANRKAVADAMRRRPPQGANRDQPNPRAQQGQSQSRPGSEGQAGQGRSDPRQARRPPPSPRSGEPPQDGRSPGEPPPSPDGRQADGRADQRSADAAQRERMARALGQQRPAERGRDAQGTPDRAERAADRERAMATEALLRRVPDDPGGLLRAKFQLEYERRQAQGEDR